MDLKAFLSFILFLFVASRIIDCPYGHFLSQGKCVECFSKCPHCDIESLKNDICQECGEGLKLNQQYNGCVACEQDEFQCEKSTSFFEYHPSINQVFVTDENYQTQICDYCFKVPQKCYKTYQQGEQKRQKKCSPYAIIKEKVSLIEDRKYVNVSFKNVQFKSYSIKKSYYSGTCFFKPLFEETQFQEDNFEKDNYFFLANFKESRLKDSSFHNNVIFEDCNFIKTFLLRINFSQGVLFTSSYFQKTEIIQSNYEDQVQFRNSSFKKAFIGNSSFRNKIAFQNVEFLQSYFVNAYFEKVDFSNVLFKRVDLEGSNFTNVVFKGSNFYKVSFQNAFFTNVTFQNSNLINVRLNQSHLKNVVVKNCFVENLSKGDDIVFIKNSSIYTQEQNQIINTEVAHYFADDSLICSKCIKRCFLCLHTPYQCLKCALGYIRQGWKCIKEDNFKFVLKFQSTKNELIQNLLILRQEFLAMDEKLTNNPESLTIRQVYESDNMVFVVGICEQKSIKDKLRRLDSLGNIKVLGFQELSESSLLQFFLIFLILITVLLVILLFGRKYLTVLGKNNSSLAYKQFQQKNEK